MMKVNGLRFWNIDDSTCIWYIRVASYKIIKSIVNNEILGYKYINNYGNFNDYNISIFLLINISNSHYIYGYYNQNKGNLNENYHIPNISIFDKSLNIENKSIMNFKKFKKTKRLHPRWNYKIL